MNNQSVVIRDKSTGEILHTFKVLRDELVCEFVEMIEEAGKYTVEVKEGV